MEGWNITANANHPPRIFAAGEVSGGVHGENRLMGNSLLDVTVFAGLLESMPRFMRKRRQKRVN